MKKIETIELPPASPGTKSSLRVIKFGKPGTGPKVYIQAGLHADEAPGFVVAHHLENFFDAADIVGEIILVPMANPLGLNQWRDETLQGRFHFATSINFNRQHLDLINDIAKIIDGQLSDDAAKNVSLIRKVSAEVLHDVSPEDDAGYLKKQLLCLAHDADIVLDLHCDHEALLHLYMGTPLWPDGAELAAHMQAEVTLLAKNSGDNPFDEACSRLWWDLAARFPEFPIPSACFSVTVELRGICDTAPGMAEKDAKNIFAFLQRKKVIAGVPPTLPPLLNEATPLTGVDYVKAQAPGIIVYYKYPGERVVKDEVIAEIINPHLGDREKKVKLVKSSTDGLLFTRNVDRFARPGKIIAKIAGKTPLRGEDSKLLTI